jgi:hypothetical protein
MGAIHAPSVNQKMQALVSKLITIDGILWQCCSRVGPLL